MPPPGPFAANLVLILKALSLTRGRLAAGVGVDKSVAGRWCAGTTAPSAHSLEGLTRFVAGRIPGFTMLDWELDMPAMAAKLGVPLISELAVAGPNLSGPMPAALFQEAIATTRLCGAGHEGFWRTTRFTTELGGRFVHDHLVQRLGPDGVLRIRLGVFNLRFEGWGVAIQDQLFTCVGDALAGGLIFSIISGVGRRKAVVLDGLCLSCSRNGEFNGAIQATPCLWERVGDISGDIEADDRHLEELLQQSPFAPEGSISPEIRSHLLPDIGPTSAANGGSLMLIMQASRSLSRAAVLGGEAYLANGIGDQTLSKPASA